MAADYIPSEDGAFDTWQQAFVTYLSANAAALGIDPVAGAEGGKRAHYMLRWENTRGEPAPWSETASATIGA